MVTADRRRAGWGGRSPRRAAVAAAALVWVVGGTGCSAAGPGATSAPPAPQTSTETLERAAAAEQPPAASSLEGAPAQAHVLSADPDQHSQIGVLVPGFPIELLPVPADAVILVTSAEPVGGADVQEVSLNLRTKASVDAVLTLYRSTLVDAGFTEVEPVPATADLAAEATFTRSGGDELVSIGVLEADGGSTVTIGGRLRTPTE